MSTPDARHARWRREWLGVSALLALLALLLGAGSWTWRLDQAAYDTGLSLWSRPAPDDIVLVTIDEASLRQLGQWPWPRALHATVIQQINQAQPKAILLDLLLSEPSPDPEQDQVLAQAIQQSGKVVLPLSFEALPQHLVRELPPVPALRAPAHLAHADAELDVDGVLRWAALHAGIAPGRHPHMALALLQVAGEPMHASIQAQSAPASAATNPVWRRDDRVLVRYIGPPGTVKQVSFAAVLRGDVPANVFTGRYVLIGASAIGLGDWYQTPVSGLSQAMPAVEITANLLQMLRTGDWVRPVPPLVVGVVSAGLILGLMFAFIRLSPYQALLAALLSALGVALASCALLAAGVWFAPTAFLLTALLAYPVWSWRRLETTQDFLDAEILRLAATPEPPSPESPKQHVPRDQVERRIAAIQGANARLQQAQQLLVNTLEAMPEAVLVVDGRGQVRQANPQLGTLLNLADQDTLTGQSLDTLLARWMPTDAPRWTMLLERALAEERVIITEVHGPFDQHLLARIAPLPSAANQPPWLVLCLADITPIRLIEQQRDELLGFIAHDIRSPQASLISLVQLQHMTRAAMPAEEVLDHVDMLARSTLALCDELLQIMRAETHPIQQQPTNLAQVAEQALKEVDLQARVKDITMVKDWAPDWTPVLPLDQSLVRRALINLLNNAIKFSPQGSEVRLRMTPQEGFCVIAVIDRGPGIPPAELKKLFRRYERLESSTAARVTAGVGLGLVFIDTVARRHGGRVQVHSEPGQGSCFELWLPSPTPP
ncbi:MAG: CHASE2 domain-containing protein [Aquabacterium sp.]|uniref:CHASE2 domain-containing protein n=1 Tax=Aquabacterium sp. TaxID=1872578 RepID=UPI002723021B|nr:CHASE2 domain-containing protein [Aquabacterium sp.]MDO9006193.1 CHASE2 domain-containing protein [Aquabacterium sp.]